MRYALALLLLLVSSVASAQVYKCTHDGHVAYQDIPCAGSDQSTQLHVGADSMNDLLGCFGVAPGPGNGADYAIEVRKTVDGFQLRRIGTPWASSNADLLHRASPHELDNLRANLHLRVQYGLTSRWFSDTDPAATGFYKSEDARGRTQYFVVFRNRHASALRTACP